MDSPPFRGASMVNAAPTLATGLPMETADEQKRRFEIECEFVQALANPHYLNFLAQRGYFKEEHFINYLKYLLYWKRTEYARALKFPQALYFLDLLQEPLFREAIASTANAKFCEEQQLLQWQYYIRKRFRLQSLPTTVTSASDNTDPIATAASSSNSMH